MVDKHCIMMLGSGRSGITIVTKALQHMGANISGEFIHASEANSSGVFVVDNDISDVTQSLISEINLSEYLPFDADWFCSEGVSEAVEKLLPLVTERMGEQDAIWCMTDPKSTMLIPMWEKVFNLSEVAPKYILTVRDPRHVCESMHRHLGIDYKMAEFIWLQRNVSALWDTGARCFIVHYESLQSDSGKALSELSNYCGFVPNGLELNGIFQNDYNRAQYTGYIIKSGLVLELYSKLKECEGAAFDHSGLMSVVAKCRNMMEELSGVTVAAKLMLKERDKRITELMMKSSCNEGKLKKVLLENNSLVISNKDLLDEIESYKKYKAKALDKTGGYQWARKTIYPHGIASIEESFSYKLGNTIVKAFKYPGLNTLALPYRLLRLSLRHVRSR